jgi:hypothetical protein
MTTPALATASCAGDMADAKLLSNMAASQLALEKFVAAAM